MAWIESHTVLMRHRKVAHLAQRLRLRRSYVIGHLHSLWHAALEQQDDGDLTGWSDEFIAESSDFPCSGCDAPQWVRLLQETGWLDGKLLHDWTDYAGRFLMMRYGSSNRDRLVAIWLKHGRTYGKEKAPPEQSPIAKDSTSKQEESSKKVVSESYHTKPNLSDHTKPTDSAAVATVTNGTPQKKQRSPPTADHPIAVAYWCEKWELRHGAKCVFNGGKDGEHVKFILKGCGTQSEFQRVVDAYLADAKPYLFDERHPLSLLRANVNKYLAQSSPPANSHSRKPSARDDDQQRIIDLAFAEMENPQ